MKAKSFVASAFLLAAFPCASSSAPNLQDGAGERLSTAPPAVPQPRLHNLAPDEERALDRGEETPDVFAVTGHSCGIQAEGDEVLGLGPRYKVRFQDGAFEFTPALGREAPRNFPLTYRLDSIRRGGQVLFRAEDPVRPVADEEGVSYPRSEWIVERYDVRAEGMEQSFVFEELPAGSGELVVRGRIQSELCCKSPGASRAGLSFEAVGLGGVHFGAVQGIDATGRTAAGELRFQDGWLELALPSEFVDTAAFPLVLDPVVGAKITSSSATFDDNDPDVAYDRSSNSYLAVWERQFSVTDVDIRGQRIGSGGALLGGALAIESGVPTVSANPTVANCNTTNTYLVAWQEGSSLLGPWNIRARSVAASSGSLSGTVSIASTAADEVDPDAGGDSQVGDDDVLVVWTELGSGIEGAQVTVPSDADPYVLTTFAISTDDDDSRPAISKAGGTVGRFLVAWQRFFSSPIPGDHDLFGRVVDRNGNLLTPGTLLVESVGPNEEHVDVDGNGTRWLIAFEYQEGLGTGDKDIFCMLTEYAGGTLDSVTSSVSVDADAEQELRPAVAFAGHKYYVAWCDQAAGLDHDIWVIGLNPVDCSVCETEFSLGGGAGYESGVELCSQESGQPGAGDRLLAVWEDNELSQPFEGTIEARRFEEFGTGSVVTNLGGGCGPSGDISFVGLPSPGNSSFAVSINGADPAAVVGILGITDVVGPTTCGSCTINKPLLTPSTLLNGGSGTVALPIPCRPGLVGKTFEFQWIVGLVPVSPCPTYPGIAFTDRLSVTVAY